MKKSIFILAVIASLVLVSCEKVLTKDPLTKFTNDNYWSSEANVELYANYFYSTFTAYGTGGSGNFYFPSLNDNQLSSSFQNWKSTSVDASNSNWNNCYSEIRRANILIEHIKDVPGMSETKKAKWEGIARLYRAMQHYELVRQFGDCYWVEKVLTPQDEDVLYGPRQDRDGVMDKVLEDLNYAVLNIPATSGRTEFNQQVAQAIKSEICLYEGTFCKYRTADENGKAADKSRAERFLTESKSASAAIIGNSMYALNTKENAQPGPGGVFAKYPAYQANYNSLDLAGNTEMIMYKKYETSLITHGVSDYTVSSTTQKGMSKDAFDSFLFIDGECLANTTCDKNDKAVFTEKVVEGTTTWDTDLSAVLATRDPRLAIDVDDCLMYNGTSATPRIGYDGGSMATTSSSGYGVKKFDNLNIEWIHRNNANSCYTDAPVYWLAVILLNHAEACAETGDADGAVADINKLRDRVGMPHLSKTPKADPKNNMGISDLLWEVRRERRVELMYDNDDRYWCLIRWHQLDKLDTVKYPDIVSGAWVGDHIANGSTAKTDSRGYLSTASYGDRKFEARQYLRPIPSGQADYNPQIGQNPGW
ncbi:MAG: RagB/SusD family nutrient uptake outer membrane protein [Bacteroidales bacterium]|nr:RagB/SusD family nutrient uptake outer membrane protein [Candidatus Cacconaster caballi]